MKTIIKEVRGDSLTDTGECTFCYTKAKYILACIAGKKPDGHILKGFRVCKEHFDKVNALLSGDFDIDRIELERYRKRYAGSGIRMRTM